MADAFKVITGSRLHFGPLAWKPRHGRDFGGWGVMLGTPRTVVRVGDFELIAKPGSVKTATQARAESILRQLLAERSTNQRTPVSVAVDEEPPAHCGFGSGTQLALAVAAGLAAFISGDRPPATELARRVRRGLRSAVGIHGFDHGGLIIDAGKLPGEDVGLLAAQVEIPRGWRFVLVRPDAAAGLTGEQERTAFSDLAPFSDILTTRLRSLVFEEILPATQNSDCKRFARALDEYGTLVGESFRSAQGDLVHAAAVPIWKGLRALGVQGIAQTSWGPTLAIVCPDADEAARVAELARSVAGNAHVDVATPKNRGADIHPA